MTGETRPTAVTPDDPAAQALWSADAFRGPWRKAARARFVAAVSGDFDSEEDWADAASCLTAWLDTWSLAGLVDHALTRWRDVADPTALAVLGRAAEVIVAATGWAAADAGPWPIPPGGWLEQQGLPTRDAPPPAPAGLLRVRGAELAPRRSELARAMARGETVAVAVQGDVPADVPSRLALGELRMEAARQDAWDRFGALGLACSDDPPGWSELRGSAPSGATSDAPVARCEGTYAPGPPGSVRRGELDDIGYLLWEGPFEPIPVQREAVAVIRALDGERTPAEVAGATGLPAKFVSDVLAELIAVGAAGGDE